MAEETGIILSWEKDAMAGLEMPDGLSYPDQILYLSLRMLYAQYFKKVIDRETATKEKRNCSTNIGATSSRTIWARNM